MLACNWSLDSYRYTLDSHDCSFSLFITFDSEIDKIFLNELFLLTVAINAGEWKQIRKCLQIFPNNIDANILPLADNKISAEANLTKYS